MSLFKFFRKFLLLFFVLVIVIVLLITTRKNIHRVKGGELPRVYRTAQMTPAELKKFIKKNHVDIVLNLRGESKAPSYLDEAQAAKDMGIDFYAYGFSAYRPPDRERFLKILDVLEKAKAENKTLLIHCKAGADRTGLISSIVQIHLYDFTVDQAYKDSLGLGYGHWHKPHGALEQVLENYKAYQKQMSFREWIETKYDREAILQYYEDHRLKLPFDIRL